VGIGSVIQDFLSNGVECSIVDSFEEADSRRSETRAFRIKEKNILIVTDKKKGISICKFIEQFNASPRILGKNETKEVTGYPACCLCPFGLKNPLKVYIDVSLKANEHISVPAGMKNYVDYLSHSIARSTKEKIRSLNANSIYTKRSWSHLENKFKRIDIS
jgi:prolyl-tRNA editing enzyme YbaK/EbsC (Cys-tRNA(Pro) deacylase)